MVWSAFLLFGLLLREPLWPLDKLGSSVGGESTHYAPAENLEHLDFTVLSGTRKRVDVAMYAMTDRYLAELLVELAEKGVVIRLYRDGEQFQQEEARGNSVTAILRGSQNIHIRVKAPSRKLLMHLKAYVRDPDEPENRMLRDGSANWSPAGLKAQDNQLRFSTAEESIRNFETVFADLWDRSSNTIVQ